jgi:hypothetical protein
VKPLEIPTRIVTLLLLASLLAPLRPILAGNLPDSDGRFLIRGSTSVFWNRGWEDRFFFGPKWDSLLSASDCMKTLRITSFGDPEIWWRAAASDRVSFYLTAGYQHLSLRLRDSASYLDWSVGETNWHTVTEYKALEAELHFFSLGGRLCFQKLPLSPYVGENIGLCRGTLSTSDLAHRLDNAILERYIHVDGSGGGLFLDIMTGVQGAIWDHLVLFAECGYRYTPEWNSFEPESVWTTLPPNRIGSWSTEDRHLKFLGPYLSFGLQMRL